MPCDGYLGRVQIVRYHSETGYLASHQDPVDNQRLVVSIYLSKLGIDFQHGGLWALDRNNKKICLEPNLQIGDIGSYYAQIIHGVDKIDNGSDSERWWLGLFTNDSDLVQTRKTIEPAAITSI